MVRLMEIQGETICPVCRLEEENRRLEKEMNVFRYEKEERKRKSIFYDHSLIKDETVKLARFSTFISECEEDENNLILAKKALTDYLNDIRFNLILVGKVGGLEKVILHTL